MRELIKVKAAELFGFVDEMLKQGERVWITVTGMSMYPFLREGRDSVELSDVSYDDVKKGDIVLIRRETGQYVLHRLLKKEKDHFYIIGDAQQWVEGPLEPAQLLAYVTRIKRGNRIISCSNILLKSAVCIWLSIVPLRKNIMRAYMRIRHQLSVMCSLRSKC